MYSSGGLPLGYILRLKEQRADWLRGGGGTERGVVGAP